MNQEVDTFIDHTQYRRFIPQDFSFTGDVGAVLAWIKNYNAQKHILSYIDPEDEEIYCGGKNCSVTFTVNPMENVVELKFEDVWDSAEGYPVWTMLEELMETESDKFKGTMVGYYVESGDENFLTAKHFGTTPVMIVDGFRVPVQMVVADQEYLTKLAEIISKENAE